MNVFPTIRSESMLTTTFCVRCSGRSNSSEVCPNCVKELDRLHDEAYDENLAWQDEAEYESEREYYDEEPNEQPRMVLYALRRYVCDGGGTLGVFSSEEGAKSYAIKAIKDCPDLVGLWYGDSIPQWQRVVELGRESLDIGHYDGIRGSMLSIYEIEVDPEFKPRF